MTSIYKESTILHGYNLLFQFEQQTGLGYLQEETKYSLMRMYLASSFTAKGV